MGGSAAKKGSAWYGFLDAGAKSSPVAMDPGLDTGNSATVYLFNLQRNAILEYRRDLVEPKLRELEASEETVLNDLQAAFVAAVSGFSPRGSRSAAAVERVRPRKTSAETMLSDIDLDSDDSEVSSDVDDGDDDADWDSDDS
jgi:hypothetical protein